MVGSGVASGRLVAPSSWSGTADAVPTIIMTTINYSIDTGEGNQITAGIQGYDLARKYAQQLADERGETVYLYAPSEVRAAEAAGEEHESEAVEPDTTRCGCGAWSGVRCEWVGPRAETVLVEWMPESLRASHVAAGNRGRHPHNGARHIVVHTDCAERMVEDDADWVTVLTAVGTVHDYQTGVVLPGRASVDLAAASTAAAPNGVVLARRNSADVWHLIAEDRREYWHGRGAEVRSVWVAE